MSSVIVYFANGMEECEALITVDILRRCGIEVTTASVHDTKEITTSHNIKVEADAMAKDTDCLNYDMIMLPGGKGGTDNLKASPMVKEACRVMAETKGKYVAAICAAPSVLGQLGLLQGKRATCYPGFEDQLTGCEYTGEDVVICGNIITGKGMGVTIPFALQAASLLVGGETAEKVREQIMYPFGIRDNDLYANYHTHSFLCHHATGTLEEYVQTAIKNGLKVLGFSDHVPMDFVSKKGYRSSFRMTLEEMKYYVETILSLKEKYKDQITIYVGYEAEYYPDEYEHMIEVLTSLPVDYMILGQHFTNNEHDGVSTQMGTDDRKALAAYVDQVLTGVRKGTYSYVAHPDVFRWDGDDETYREEMGRLVDGCIEMNIPLEFNMLGFFTGRHYPGDRFLKLLADKKAKVVLGCDAHEAERVADPKELKKAYAKLREYGIEPVAEVKLRPLK